MLAVEHVFKYNLREETTSFNARTRGAINTGALSRPNTVKECVTMIPDFTPNTIEFQLSNGSTVIVDDIDRDLTLLRWSAKARGKFIYGYRQRVIDGTPKDSHLHRVILERKIGRPLNRGEFCDHINMNTLDNRRSNLRVASASENRQNSGKRSNNTSGYKGVTYHKGRGKWRAQIKFNGKYKTLGEFNSAEEAYVAYCEGAKRYHGEFANLDNGEGGAK